MLPLAHDTGASNTPGATPASHRRNPWSLPATGHDSPLTNYSSSRIQSLAKDNRKSSQVIENNHQRLNSIASFCRFFPALLGASKPVQTFLIDSPAIRNRPNSQKTNHIIFSNRQYFAISVTLLALRSLRIVSTNLLTPSSKFRGPLTPMLLFLPRMIPQRSR
jgi:hypothetical protein